MMATLVRIRSIRFSFGANSGQSLPQTFLAACCSYRSARSNVRSGTTFDLNYINFKVAKGATYERVLIIATGPITTFLQRGKSLDPGPAATFYVAVTRAQQSIAIVLDRPGESLIPYWEP